MVQDQKRITLNKASVRMVASNSQNRTHTAEKLSADFVSLMDLVAWGSTVSIYTPSRNTAVLHTLH